MTGMTGPGWLADIVGTLMLAAAVCAIVRIVGAWRARRATDFSVEACHAVMGVSMAGMLIPALKIVTPGASAWSWIVVSSLIAVWFAIRVIDQLSAPTAKLAGRPRRLHHLPHLVLSGAMVYMLVAAETAGSGGSMSSMSAMPDMPGMDMEPAAAPTTTMPLATLNLLLAFFLIGYAVLLTDRLPRIAQLGGVGSPRILGRGGAGAAMGAAGAAGALYAPRVGAGLSLAMSGAMAYMLVMMFA